MSGEGPGESQGPSLEGRILVVDDNVPLLASLSDVLTYEGYKVGTASSGEEALRYIKQSKPNYPDLVILDISMPGMGGIGFLQKMNQIRAEDDDYSRIKVMVLTARANMREFFMESDLGVYDFLAKPCDPNDLLASVKKVLAAPYQERAQAAPAQYTS